MNKGRRPSAEPTVTFWGCTVTGSMHRVDACGQSLLLDCGLFQGHRAESRAGTQRGVPVPPERTSTPSSLSHAHIDHCGNLPNLVAPGLFRADLLHSPPSTRALAGRHARRRRQDSDGGRRLPQPQSARKGQPERSSQALRQPRRLSNALLRLEGDTLRRAGVRRAGAGGDVRGRRPPAWIGDDSAPLRRAGRRAAADVHRRPWPAGACRSCERPRRCPPATC